MDKNAIAKLTDELVSLQKENTLLTSENAILHSFFDKVVNMVENPKTWEDNAGVTHKCISIEHEELIPYIEFARSCLNNVPV